MSSFEELMREARRNNLEEERKCKQLLAEIAERKRKQEEDEQRRKAALEDAKKAALRLPSTIEAVRSAPSPGSATQSATLSRGSNSPSLKQASDRKPRSEPTPRRDDLASRRPQPTDFAKGGSSSGAQLSQPGGRPRDQYHRREERGDTSNKIEARSDGRHSERDRDRDRLIGRAAHPNRTAGPGRFQRDEVGVGSRSSEGVRKPDPQASDRTHRPLSPERQHASGRSDSHRPRDPRAIDPRRGSDRNTSSLPQRAGDARGSSVPKPAAARPPPPARSRTHTPIALKGGLKKGPVGDFIPLNQNKRDTRTLEEIQDEMLKRKQAKTGEDQLTARERQRQERERERERIEKLKRERIEERQRLLKEKISRDNGESKSDADSASPDRVKSHYDKDPDRAKASHRADRHSQERGRADERPSEKHGSRSRDGHDGLDTKRRSETGMRHKPGSQGRPGDRYKDTDSDDDRAYAKKKRSSSLSDDDDDRYGRARARDRNQKRYKTIDEMDPDEIEGNTSSIIFNMFRYNPHRYADDDIDDMEVGATDIFKEERRSAKIAKREDELEEQREMERLERIKKQRRSGY
ncbi:uncharacterized protein BJ171DRAFT_566344 [Polychytrium aggregatum]|uniref:uncharacterized protein n=1 Tax=Polychytrium aggregatum TaxID=110093 RepID=UPI0022FEDAF4|nr:uncharacterized protein BJ171DRAFT_566344 [Polychytrium aggregatum]KAI9206992.1 hypothetical protein BJ171DRAFT_566344 [Polychytrium aggregatum]